MVCGAALAAATSMACRLSNELRVCGGNDESQALKAHRCKPHQLLRHQQMVFGKDFLLEVIARPNNVAGCGKLKYTLLHRNSVLI